MDRIIFTKDGSIVATNVFLLKDEKYLFKTRRRIEEGLQADDPYCECLSCEQPAILVPRGKEQKLLFSHLPGSGACPQKKERTSKKKSKYELKEESELHKDLKDFVLSYLIKNHIDVSEINVEVYVRDPHNRKAWRRADILVTFSDGKRLAIEIQCSRTSLKTIVGRETFYRQNGIYLLWIFPDSSLLLKHLEVTMKDIAYGNHNCIFVLDPKAQRRTQATRELTLTCFYENPDSSGEFMGSTWKRECVSLRDLVCDTDYKVYYPGTPRQHATKYNYLMRS